MVEKYPVDPVVEAYKRFQHLDRLIVDAGTGDDLYHKTCAALWDAVKQHCKRVGYAGPVEERAITRVALSSEMRPDERRWER